MRNVRSRHNRVRLEHVTPVVEGECLIVPVDADLDAHRRCREELRKPGASWMWSPETRDVRPEALVHDAAEVVVRRVLAVAVLRDRGAGRVRAGGSGAAGDVRCRGTRR